LRDYYEICTTETLAGLVHIGGCPNFSDRRKIATFWALGP